MVRRLRERRGEPRPTSLTGGTLPASEDVEDVQQHDDDDGNPEQPGDDALHDDLLLGEGTSHRGGVWYLPVRWGL